MNRLLLFALVLAFAFDLVSAQSNAQDTLMIDEGFFGMNYYRNSKEVTKSDFEFALRSSPDSSVFELYSSGSSLKSVSNVFGFAGGFCLGYGLTSKPTDSGLSILGGALVVASIVIEGNGISEMEEAVARYNRASSRASAHSLQPPQSLPQPSLGISIRL